MEEIFALAGPLKYKRTFHDSGNYPGGDPQKKFYHFLELCLIKKWLIKSGYTVNVAIGTSGKWNYEIFRWLGGAKGWERYLLGGQYTSYEEALQEGTHKILKLLNDAME